MIVKEDVMSVLMRSSTSGCALQLPPEQLDRKLYVATNKVIESIGGIWNRKAKAHLFDHDPEEDLEQIINTGEWTDQKKEYQFFPTPDDVVKRMVEMAKIESTNVLLEPSAGMGNILKFFPKNNPYIAIELMPKNCETLRNIGFSVHEGDFLSIDFLTYDRVIMNPPFTKQQDIDHVLHAWEHMNDDGILVSVVSESPFYRENKKSISFRNWLLENKAEVFPLEEGTYKESGTMIRSRIIKVKK